MGRFRTVDQIEITSEGYFMHRFIRQIPTSFDILKFGDRSSICGSLDYFSESATTSLINRKKDTSAHLCSWNSSKWRETGIIIDSLPDFQRYQRRR